MYHIHQIIKKYFLRRLILCASVGLSATLPVSVVASEFHVQKNYVYTLRSSAYCMSPIAEEEEVPLPPGQLLIPANGECLYTAIIMGYLLPARQATDVVTVRINQLFGLQPARDINQLYQNLVHPTHYLTYLYSDAFSTLVTAFMTRMKIKKGTWGGPIEIQTIANKLTINIQEYYPDPSNPTTLLESDLTKPYQRDTPVTLHIVRDKVHPNEVLTQAEKASAKESPHYQHYRLKYTLPLSSEAPLLPSQQLPISHYIAPPQQTPLDTQSWFKTVNTGDSRLLAQLCRDYNVDVDIKDKKGNTALLLNAYNGYLACIKFLLQKGADIHHKNKNNYTALLWSAHKGHLHCVKFLVEQGANISTQNTQGNTAMLLSAHSGHLNCVKYLLQQGDDIHHKNKNGYTALLLSTYSGHLDCLQFLVEQGACIEEKNEHEHAALTLSAQEGHLDCLQFLIQQDIHLNISTKNGYTALHLSAYNGHLNCIKLLVQKGADTNTSDHDGYTPLLLSAQKGHLHSVKYLVQQGAYTNTSDHGGNTALHLSAQYGHLDTIKYLLQRGADINAKNRYGEIALHCSALNGHLHCLKYLIQQGADINTCNNDGYTALLLSAHYERLDCVVYLLQQSANGTSKQEEHKTTLQPTAADDENEQQDIANNIAEKEQLDKIVPKNKARTASSWWDITLLAALFYK